MFDFNHWFTVFNWMWIFVILTSWNSILYARYSYQIRNYNNEFIRYNYQTKTLIQIAEHNLSDLSLELPCIFSQLSSFHLVDTKYNTNINKILLTTESPRLQALTISHCDLSQLHLILNYTYQLKYLKAEFILGDSQFVGESMQTTTINLKYLIINNYTDDFFNLESIFRRIPTSECLNISVRDVLVIEANQWENWIVNFLSNLKIFRFQLHFRDQQLMNNIEYLFNEFQNNFWLKEHQWYTEYLFDSILFKFISNSR